MISAPQIFPNIMALNVWSQTLGRRVFLSFHFSLLLSDFFADFLLNDILPGDCLTFEKIKSVVEDVVVERSKNLKIF